MKQVYAVYHDGTIVCQFEEKKHAYRLREQSDMHLSVEKHILFASLAERDSLRD